MPAVADQFTVDRYGDQWQENTDIAILKDGLFVESHRILFTVYGKNRILYCVGD